MDGQALASVFAGAAMPQKVMLVTLAAAIPITPVAACLALANRAHDRVWRRLIAEIRLAGPALGLLVGALNSFHMARTILLVPFDPNAKQLAPGILEVATFIGLGALAGLTAALVDLVLSRAGGTYSDKYKNSKPGGAAAAFKTGGTLFSATVVAIICLSIFAIFIWGLR